MAKKFVVRRIDGRLIRTVETREEARAAARKAATTTAVSIALEDVKPIPFTATGQQDTASLVKALELVLNLTPEQCEREYKAELRRKLDQRYLGEGL
jgi:hypothetical protein